MGLAGAGGRPERGGYVDAGDLRVAGIDYAFNDTVHGNGPVLGVAIANWAPVHTLQPYFDETDLWINQNRDGGLGLCVLQLELRLAHGR